MKPARKHKKTNSITRRESLYDKVTYVPLDTAYKRKNVNYGRLMADIRTQIRESFSSETTSDTQTTRTLSMSELRPDKRYTMRAIVGDVKINKSANNGRAYLHVLLLNVFVYQNANNGRSFKFAQHMWLSFSSIDCVSSPMAMSIGDVVLFESAFKLYSKRDYKTGLRFNTYGLEEVEIMASGYPDLSLRKGGSIIDRFVPTQYPRLKHEYIFRTEDPNLFSFGKQAHEDSDMRELMYKTMSTVNREKNPDVELLQFVPIDD